MSKDSALIPVPSICEELGPRFGVSPAELANTLAKTVMPAGATSEHLVAFLMVAREFGLNPVLKQIYAFPAKGGGIQPVISIDGWLSIVNSHPKFDGLTTEDVQHDKLGLGCRATIHVKDRSHPVVITEWLNECKRNTEPWNNWPTRMLRHKAIIQCARVAFGLSGAVDHDEYERQVEVQDVTPGRKPAGGPATSMEDLARRAQPAREPEPEPKSGAPATDAKPARVIDMEPGASAAEPQPEVWFGGVRIDQAALDAAPTLGAAMTKGMFTGMNWHQAVRSAAPEHVARVQSGIETASRECANAGAAAMTGQLLALACKMANDAGELPWQVMS